jgi:23S rRNA (cytosine1962-C5)-methyltransferase
VTVDKFGRTLFVQSWRNPLLQRDVRELCDAAFGGQLGFDDVESVWVHPRARSASGGAAFFSDGDDTRIESRAASEDDAFAVSGVYERSSRFSEGDSAFASGMASPRPDVFGRDVSNPELSHAFQELGLKYEFVPPRKFGDPSLYLDFRPTRRWIVAKTVQLVRARETSGRGVSALNAFAYTCGAGLAATAGGATRVLNTDHSATYLAYGAKNYSLNGFAVAPSASSPDADSSRDSDPLFESYCEDFYPAVRLLAGLPMPGRQSRGGGRGNRGRGGRDGSLRRGRGEREPSLKKAKPPRPETFDLVILDPPTFTKTAYGAVDIENDYQSLAKPAALCVSPGGVLLATNHSSRVDLDDWLEIVERCAKKAGCVVSKIEVVSPEEDDDDHPAMADGKRPLKVAAFTLE